MTANWDDNDLLRELERYERELIASNRQPLTVHTYDRIDHLVLTVKSVETTCEFYREALGLEIVTFGAGRRALQVGRQKINLHEVGREFEPKARRPTPGSGDFCVVTSRPLTQLVDHLTALGVAIEAGPVERTGATGPIRSIYLRDPDGNLVEVANEDG